MCVLILLSYFTLIGLGLISKFGYAVDSNNLPLGRDLWFVHSSHDLSLASVSAYYAENLTVD